MQRGTILFVIAIFFIGKQKNLFNPVFKLNTTFYNVSGLQVGSNVRFSGINVGTVDNTEIISRELAEIMVKVNSGSGTLGRLIQDSVFAENFTQTMVNLKKSSNGLNEDMQAAQHNFLLKGYFNKKKKAAEEKKEEDQKIIDDKK